MSITLLWKGHNVIYCDSLSIEGCVWGTYADKKENKIFFINKEIQIGSGAKSWKEFIFISND
jgi:hypothetical protein